VNREGEGGWWLRGCRAPLAPQRRVAVAVHLLGELPLWLAMGNEPGTLGRVARCGSVLRDWKRAWCKKGGKACTI
jgi:hypothetical protein